MRRSFYRKVCEVFGLNSLFSLIFTGVMSILLYILTSKFRYITNVIIFGIIKVISTLFVLQERTFGSIVLNIFSDVIIGFIVVYVAHKIRDCFDYDTIVSYLMIVSFVYIIVSAIMIKLISLF